MAKPESVSTPYRVKDGRGFRLKDIDPGDTGGIQSHEEAQRLLERGLSSLRDMQEKLHDDCSIFIERSFEIADLAIARFPEFLINVFFRIDLRQIGAEDHFGMDLGYQHILIVRPVENADFSS